MKAFETISRYGMLLSGDAVLAGVSGGADSMSLLHVLCSLREEYGLRVLAAHIHHGIRGKEADLDEEFVRRYCAEWDVRLHVLHADVPAVSAMTGESLEEAGRRIRYEFFQKLSKQENAKIATAHTLSDSIETFLLNFSRGTGLKGLCGIPPVRDGIIRPLIETTRAEVEAYCAENSIPFRNDSTNSDRDFARNRIRLDAVPALYSVNPSLDRAALRTMKILSREESLLNRLAENALNDSRLSDGGYDLNALLKAPPELLPRVLSLAAGRTGSVQESVHVKKLLQIVKNGKGAVQLKGGYLAKAEQGSLYFLPPDKAGRTDDFVAPLREGTFQNGGFRLEIRYLEKKEIENFKNVHIPYFKNLLDCDKILGKAIIRSRKPGEKYYPAGRDVRKSLKKLLYEAGVPAHRRDFVPVLADDAGILWVWGCGPDGRCRITDATKRAIYLKTTDMGG